jgi:hypothetical protein
VTALRDALVEIAERAPDVRVPSDFYRSARRRHRLRRAWAAAAVLVAAALAVPFVAVGGGGSEDVGGGSAGLPDRLVVPPWSTETVDRSPAGPAAVVYSGEDIVPQADSEDWDLAWWRTGYTVGPSVVVGLSGDTYRIVRGSYSVGTELSPDGRYLLLDSKAVLDLTTGRTRQLLPKNTRMTTQGVWSADGTRILYVEDDVTTVVSWPSGRVERRFRHPGHVPVELDVALSGDGSMLAVHSNERFDVYRGDGTRLWGWTGRRDRIGGPAAWRGNDQLAVFERVDLVCDYCNPHPGTWRLTIVDGASGMADTVPVYPEVRSALDVRVVAWRGEVAYCVVVYSAGPTDTVDRVELVRLRPLASAPETLLRAPAGATDLGVATGYVDQRRATGEPHFGYNRREAVGQTLAWAPCLLPFVAVALGLVIRRRVQARRLASSR